MTDQDATVVRHTEDDGVAVLTLDRPAKRNALIWESWSGIGAALDRIEAEQRVGAVVLTGEGPFFSAGGDLGTGPARGTGAFAPAARMEHAQRVLKRLRDIPVPVVAAVEGGAVGIGWSLVLACDLVTAAADAFFSAPFAARGVMPDGGCGWLLTARLGRHRASQLLLSGERLPATDAAGLGLVTAVSAPGSALSDALATAKAIAGLDRGAVELTKRMLARAEGLDFDSYLALELATGTVAQQRGAAASARGAFT